MVATTTIRNQRDPPPYGHAGGHEDQQDLISFTQLIYFTAQNAFLV